MIAGADFHAIAERIEAVAVDITPAEQKVARQLTTSGMLAGFETVAALADRAGRGTPPAAAYTRKSAVAGIRLAGTGLRTAADVASLVFCRSSGGIRLVAWIFSAGRTA